MEEEKNQDNKDKNVNENKNKINEEDKKVPKLEQNMIFNIIEMPQKQYNINDIMNTFELHLGDPKKEFFQKNEDFSDLEKNMSDQAFLVPKKRSRSKNKEINTEKVKKDRGRKKKR